MASCSKGRVAPAPAGAPRWTDFSFSAPWLPPAARCAAWLPAPPPCWRSSIAAMTWPLRIRPVPMIPIDCASRCSSGRSIADSPAPPRRLVPVGCGSGETSASPAWASASGQERTVPADSGEVPPLPAESGTLPGNPGTAEDSSGRPEEPVIRSVVLLTRGPSQGAGAGHGLGRCHPLSRSGRSAGPVVVLSAIPALPRIPTVRRRAQPQCTARCSRPARQPPGLVPTLASAPVPGSHGTPPRGWLATLRTQLRRAPSAPGRRGGVGMDGCLWQPWPSAGCGRGLAANRRAPVPMTGHLVRHPA
jgi:hypothetical protein